jgi:hypothetical protein
VWSLVYLSKIHPLGKLSTRLDNGELGSVAIRLKGARIVGRSDGKEMWSFEAKTIDLSRDRRFVTFQNITKGTLHLNNELIASLSADKVVYNTYNKNILIPGKAEIKIKNGPSLLIKQSTWDAGRSVLICKGVSANLAGSTLQGKLMFLYPESKKLVIEKVRGTIKIPSTETQ